MLAEPLPAWLSPYVDRVNSSGMYIINVHSANCAQEYSTVHIDMVNTSGLLDQGRLANHVLLNEYTAGQV